LDKSGKKMQYFYEYLIIEVDNVKNL